MPAPLEEVAGLGAEALEALAVPGHGAAAHLAEGPARDPRGDVAQVEREAVAHEDQHEAGDDDAEHGDADEGGGRERGALAPGGQQEDGEDREGEVQELVPEAGQRDRPRHVLGPRIPSAARRRRSRRSRPPPAGHAIESAVDACVSVSAWVKPSPGSATCQGGANVDQVERRGGERARRSTATRAR